ncbi:hypothetical protein [Amylibacter sp. IMCC11727]|uniref:hypothetical protein n=1 Tax=Amylibacter sp. IMCC11727 TaxID=3039851 RepID=UPI00244E2EEF|nr:hypothetical protein [Amylibacter sp. IMCC11727]WGI21838.1 hypothetical protein QBD29_17280 [Amylibacter sp. IMCC11727]
MSGLEIGGIPVMGAALAVFGFGIVLVGWRLLGLRAKNEWDRGRSRHPRTDLPHYEFKRTVLRPPLLTRVGFLLYAIFCVAYLGWFAQATSGGWELSFEESGHFGKFFLGAVVCFGSLLFCISKLLFNYIVIEGDKISIVNDFPVTRTTFLNELRSIKQVPSYGVRTPELTFLNGRSVTLGLDFGNSEKFMNTMRGIAANNRGEL